MKTLQYDEGVPGLMDFQRRCAEADRRRSVQRGLDLKPAQRAIRASRAMVTLETKRGREMLNSLESTYEEMRSSGVTDHTPLYWLRLAIVRAKSK